MRAAIIKEGKVWNIIETDTLASDVFTLVAWQPGAQIGDLYSNGVFSKAYPPLDEFREKRIAEVKAKRDAEETKGFTYGGNEFDSDMASVLRLVTAGFAVQGGPPGTQIAWTAKSGAVVPFTPATIKEATQALVDRANLIHERARTLVASINAAQTPQAVDAIDIESGWPA